MTVEDRPAKVGGMGAGHEGLADLLDRGRLRLAAAGIEQPRREALLLLARASGESPAALAMRLRSLRAGAEATPALRRAFERMLLQREARMPFARIAGQQGFWSLELAVSGDTLIPRADSEAVITCLLALRPAPEAAPDPARDPTPDTTLRLLDLGTGTGCLLLAALSEYPRAWGVGIDRAPGACELAAGNAARNGLASRARFVCANWTEALGAARFDVVLSNPPYIRAADIAGLMPEVAGWEPRLALDGGADGLDAYRAILPQLDRLLSPEGIAVLEIGEGQGPALRTFAGEFGLSLAGSAHDLAGHERALAFRRA